LKRFSLHLRHSIGLQVVFIFRNKDVIFSVFFALV